MSPILRAFESLLNAQEKACGERVKASVGSVLSKDVLIGNNAVQQTLIDAGLSDSGTIDLQMRKSDFPSPPTQLDPVQVYGRTLQLLYYSESHGIYRLTAGTVTNER